MTPEEMVVSLRQYVEALFRERDRQLTAALNSAQLAIDKAEKTLATRLDGFPQLYVTKVELAAMREQVEAVQARLSALAREGRGEARLLRDTLQTKEGADSAHEILRESIRALDARLSGLDDMVGQEAFVMRLQAIDARFERVEKGQAGFLTEHNYETRHRELERRMADFDNWRANVTGRYVGLAIVGAIFVAVVSGVIVHLTGGG